MKQNITRQFVFASTVALALMTFATPAAAQRRWFGFGGGVIVYTDVEFQGPSLRVRGDMPNLVQEGMNDTISSIQIPNGQSWQICQDVNYRGRCQVISGSVADLRELNWNDRISSMRRVDNNSDWNGNNNGNNGYYGDNRNYRDPRNGGYSGNGYNNDGVIVFVNPNFRGQSASFTSDVPNLVPYGLNDKITSIEVPAGETWQVCQDINYGGPCQTVTGNLSDLRSMGWNDRISSMRRIDGRYGRRFNPYSR